jgi:NAD(P)-dependent dehydrogenase (short-subunit alcohol dehydrogenase family)
MTDTTRPFPAERTAVVTGAGSERGIGRALARRLARNGWAIAALDIDGPAAERVAAELRDEFGVPAIGVQVNIADESQVDAAGARIEAELPPVVGIANVAGIASPVPFLELTTAEWDRVFDVNIKGQYFVIRRLLQGMVDRGIGRVVSVSSASAQRGGGTYSKVPYSASKAAVLGLTRALAREVGEYGVTVNAVSPGPIDTDIMGGTLSDDRKADLVKDLVVDRVGTVEDVAAVIEFLLGPDTGYITGATYNVNGGLIID